MLQAPLNMANQKSTCIKKKRKKKEEEWHHWVNKIYLPSNKNSTINIVNLLMPTIPFLDLL